MDDFWDALFKKEGTSWGYEPADSAIMVSETFSQQGVNDVLIPGIGYGRNVQPFLEKGMLVSGIEISGTAIDLLKERYPLVSVYHGSVLDMPFDGKQYCGIYCYALLHLFNRTDRKRVLSGCFEQLKTGGTMVFVVISGESDLKLSLEETSDNCYIMPNGLRVFFYNDDDIEIEFKEFGLFEYKNIDEPVKFMSGLPPMKFKLISCRKEFDKDE